MRTPSNQSGNPPVKQQMILAAERLYAQHGIDGVPLLRIGAAAGTANKSAVQYHFGSKDSLINAIVTYRLDELARRRALLAARVSPTDLRRVVEANQLPLIELAEDDDCHYLTFLEQLLLHEDLFNRMPAEHIALTQAYYDRVGELIAHVPQPLLDVRIIQASAHCLHVCADRQRARAMGATVMPYAVHVSQLLDGVVAMLTAAPSAETLEALDAFPTEIPTMRGFP